MSGGHQYAGLAVDDHFRHPANRRRHDWKARTHRFKNIIGETFGVRGADVDIGCTQDNWDIGAFSEKTDMGGKAEPIGQLPYPLKICIDVAANCEQNPVRRQAIARNLQRRDSKSWITAVKSCASASIVRN